MIIQALHQSPKLCYPKEDEFEIAQYPLDKDFPDHFSKVKKILQKYDANIDDQVIKLTIGDIIYTHRKRRGNTKYYDNLRKCASDAENAAQAVKQLRHFLLSSLDHEHVTMLNGMLEDVPPILRISGLETLPGQQIAVFEAVDRWLNTVSVSLQLLCLEDQVPERRGRGRPSSPYRFEVLKLAVRWLELTGRFPAWPKLEKGMLAEDSTVFLFWCMKMIDPDITESQVKTAAEHAVKAHKAMLQFIADHPGMTFAGYLRLLLRNESEPSSST